MIQHVNDPNFIDEPESSKVTVQWLTNYFDEDNSFSNPNDNSLPPLGDPKHKFFGKMTSPSISLIDAAAFKWLIDVGEEVYTINIQLTSGYLDIEAL